MVLTLFVQFKQWLKYCGIWNLSQVKNTLVKTRARIIAAYRMVDDVTRPKKGTTAAATNKHDLIQERVT